MGVFDSFWETFQSGFIAKSKSLFSLPAPLTPAFSYLARGSAIFSKQGTSRLGRKCMKGSGSGFIVFLFGMAFSMYHVCLHVRVIVVIDFLLSIKRMYKYKWISNTESVVHEFTRLNTLSTRTYYNNFYYIASRKMRQ